MINIEDLYAAPLDDVLWHKSSYTANNGNCVELAVVPGMPALAVRDSKNPDFRPVRTGTTSMRSFTSAISAGTLVKA